MNKKNYELKRARRRGMANKYMTAAEIIKKRKVFWSNKSIFVVDCTNPEKEIEALR